MKLSAWRCPTCKHNLFVTNTGSYWCSTCQEWKDADTVDPMGRDFVRNQIIVNYEVEKTLYRMGEQ